MAGWAKQKTGYDRMTSGLINEIMSAAEAAGKIYKNAGSEKGVMMKDGRANYVTAYDEKVQEYLFEKLTGILPDAHFVGEEEGKEVFPPEYEEGYTFVVDPIDGTTNFMTGYDLSVTSVGLLRDGEPYIGVVYDPYTDRMFSAQRGMGAFENGRRIFTGDTPLSHSVVSLGTAPYYGEEITKKAFDLAFEYMKRSLDIRRTGSAAYDLCMVASGRVGLFFEPILQVWDYCAGALILEEAGGTVTDLKGMPLSFRGKCSVCAVTAGVAREKYLPDW